MVVLQIGDHHTYKPRPLHAVLGGLIDPRELPSLSPSRVKHNAGDAIDLLRHYACELLSLDLELL